jgi:hypothetical protein
MIGQMQGGAYRSNVDAGLYSGGAWRPGVAVWIAVDATVEPDNPQTEWRLVERWRSMQPTASDIVGGVGLGRHPDLTPIRVIANWQPLGPTENGFDWSVVVRLYDSGGVLFTSGAWPQSAGSSGYIAWPDAAGQVSAEFRYLGGGVEGPPSFAYYSF